MLLVDMQEASRITGRTVEGTKALLRREGVKTMLIGRARGSRSAPTS
jgi:hypothetical protein